MARVVRLLEYLGTEEHLKTWLSLSLAEGPSPMFGPDRALTVTTIESSVADIKAVTGKKRPLTPYEVYSRSGEWKEENIALRDALTQALEFNYGTHQEERLPVLRRLLERVNTLLAELEDKDAPGKE